MTILLLFIAFVILIPMLIKSISNFTKQQQRKRAIAERERLRQERENERREREYERQVRLEEKKAEAERKAEYKRLKAQQQRDSILTQIEQNQELYHSIEALLEGNITQEKRISYQKQLMTIDNRIYQLNNKLMDLEYQINE